MIIQSNFEGEQIQFYIIVIGDYIYVFTILNYISQIIKITLKISLIKPLVVVLVSKGFSFIN